MYTDKERQNDIQFYHDNQLALYKKYGRHLLVIQKQHILGIYDDIQSIISDLSPAYETGSYTIVFCMKPVPQGLIACYTEIIND